MKIVILAALLAPALATAQTVPAGPQPTAAAPATDSATEKMICRTTQDTGSLVRRTRRCLTARQWADLHRTSNSAARDYVRDTTIGQ